MLNYVKEKYVIVFMRAGAITNIGVKVWTWKNDFPQVNYLN